ncbi:MULTISPECIES: NUDIX hydrolase [Streptomyces]|uniref:NUDIX domain-containing protein n=1 Tax=Streptomyces TaxID=1883 RepID=UPI002253B802|nr:NUDIX hydrolase [Streptomyces viridodiastaticus]MCX4624553.1 NUDIX hydrolase [Streptomyces viridodiastaticus]
MSNAPQPGDPGRDVYLAEGNAKQARKRVVADALIRNDQGHVLLVDPAYKEGWDLPGGMAEANEEPLDTVARELREELGLGADCVQMRGLLCVDWVGPHGPWDDLLAFVFDGGVLPNDRVEKLSIKDDELNGFRFFAPEEALRLLPKRQRARATQALIALGDGIPRYLRDGVPAWNSSETPTGWQRT